MLSFRDTVFPRASDAFDRQGSVPAGAVSGELVVLESSAFWLWPLGSFSGFSDLFDRFDRYLKFSRFVPTSHVGVETLEGMFSLEGSDLLGEMEVFASLSKFACDSVQLDFAHW